MSLRPPRRLRPGFAIDATHALEVEILAEKAEALGRAGRKAESALAELAAVSRQDSRRPALLASAAVAVHAYFIQRELMGFRQHAEVVERLGVPRDVLARLGASPAAPPPSSPTKG